MLLLVVVIVAVLTMVRAFVIGTYVIPSDSMEPTLNATDRILVDKVARRSVHRGDIVVFDARATFGVDAAYVKRVIGVAGDEVACCSADGRLTLNGVPMDEPYVAPGEAASATKFDAVVPPGKLWVMGDHRSDSADSRSRLGAPGGGMVPVDDVIGRAVFRYWPRLRFGPLPSPVSPAAQENHS